MTKSVAVFLRIPSSVAARVAAVIVAGNKTSGVEPVLLCAGEPSVPQYFAWAGEREVERIERLRGHRPRVEEPEAPERAPGEGFVHAPFDISDELAARATKAIGRLNGIRGESGADPICQRAGKPSLPPFFYRAGLIELAQDEARAKKRRPARLSRHLRANPGDRAHAQSPIKSRSQRVLGLLAKGPLPAGDIAAKLR